MPNTKDITSNPTPSILIVGDHGTHKTRFLATVPKIFIFDFDKGLASIRGQSIEYATFKDAPRDSTPMKRAGVYTWGTGWTAFIKELNALGMQIDKNECPYDAIALDSITTLSNLCMNYVLKASGAVVAPQIQHWGAQMNLLESVMDQLTAWPITKIVTAHIQRNTNDLTQVIEMLPLLTGKLAGKIGIYFDELYFASQEKGVPVFLTQGSALQKQAKSRHNIPDRTPMVWEKLKPYFESITTNE